MVTIRPELPGDAMAREALLDRAFGRRRRRKTSQRLRDGRLPSAGLAFAATAEDGQLIGTIRLWDVVAGNAGRALLLGPVAVAHSHRNRGIGRALIEHAIAAARRRGHAAIMLVGDLAYYRRFGFAPAAVAGLALPGPVERHRFLGLELRAGALAGATGMVAAAGSLDTAASEQLRATA